MIRRAWLLFAGSWAIVFLWAGTTRQSGVNQSDVMLAFAPLVLGRLAELAMRYIVHGTIRPPYRRY